MKKILISGGSGLIGQRLSTMLLEKGYKVNILSRNPISKGDIKSFYWNPSKLEIDEYALSGVDYIVHLAGANIGDKKWTKNRKKTIIESRVKSAQLLYDSVVKGKHKIKAFIASSAIGYYGAKTSDHIYLESDTPGDDFLGQSCIAWESSSKLFNNLDVRTVILRTGVVLTPSGGALSKMLTPIKLGVGSPLGSGDQFMPWIHIEDICDMYIKAIEDDNMSGIYNAVAPQHVDNKIFMKTIAEVLGKPFVFPRVPSFTLKLLLGEMAVMVLEGSPVSSKKIADAGFEYKYPVLVDALQNLLK